MRDVVTQPMSGNTRWALSEPVNAIPISGWEFIALFGKEFIVPVEKGVINFRIKNKFYYYTLYKEEMLLKLNFESVRIRYDASDLSEVHLFSVDDDDYLETITPSPRPTRTKYKRSQQSRDALKFHQESVDKIEQGIRSKLGKYHQIVAEVENAKIPIELIDPVTDSKEIIDQANLDYFKESINTITILEDEKKKKRKNKKEYDEPTEDKKARANAEKYKYL